MSNSLASYQTSVPNCTFEEQLWIRFDLSRRHALLVGCIYCSPFASLTSSTNLLCELFHEVCALKPSHLELGILITIKLIGTPLLLMMLALILNALMISCLQYLSVPYTSISSKRLTSDLNKHLQFWI